MRPRLFLSEPSRSPPRRAASPKTHSEACNLPDNDKAIAVPSYFYPVGRAPASDFFTFLVPNAPLWHAPRRNLDRRNLARSLRPGARSDTAATGRGAAAARIEARAAGREERA